MHQMSGSHQTNLQAQILCSMITPPHAVAFIVHFVIKLLIHSNQQPLYNRSIVEQEQFVLYLLVC